MFSSLAGLPFCVCAGVRECRILFLSCAMLWYVVVASCSRRSGLFGPEAWKHLYAQVIFRSVQLFQRSP